MKTKLTVLIFLLAATLAHAQTNNLTALLQQGLFEEQANRNLDAAIADYQSLAAQFDKDRQLAATAIFRLGECYRMQGKTNEAVAQYQRILREFPEEKTLATLSRQNLAALGSAPQTVAGSSAPSQATAEMMSTIVAKETEAAALKAQLDELRKLSPSERTVAVQQNYSNPVLTKLTQDLAEAQQKLVYLHKDYKPDHPIVIGAKEVEKTIQQQISQQVDGVLMGLQTRMNADLETAKVLRVQAAVKGIRARLDATSTQTQAASQNNTASADQEDQEIQRIRQMIQNSPDLINAPEPMSALGTPLIQAAYNGWLKVAAFLLDHGADVNGVATDLKQTPGLQGAGKVTPLVAAVLAGNKTMTEFLIDHGANVDFQTALSHTPLDLAAYKGFQAVVEVLLAHHANVNARGDSGGTPLFSAVNGGRVPIIKALLAAGANVNLKNNDGWTVLNYAIKTSPEIIQPLLDAGANPNTEDVNGRTPLSYAVQNGSPELVKMLLDTKADPNSGKLDAPLLCAIHKQDVASAKLLLQAGADPNAEGRLSWSVKGESPGAVNWTPLRAAIAGNQLEIVKLLLKFKADPNQSPTNVHPLLFSALSDTNILEALLDAGAKVDGLGWAYIGNAQVANATPLEEAAGQNDAAAVGILLKRGANPNIRDARGNTALHSAAFRLADEKVFALLLDHGANPNVRDNDGQTPLDLVKRALENNASANSIVMFTANAQTERPPTARRALAKELIALLHQHGALDHLPDWDRIEVSRPSVNFSSAIFYKSTNDWNQFTLFDLLGVQYDLITASTRGVSHVPSTPYSKLAFNNSLPYPDFARIVIRRPSPSGTNWNDLKINLARALNSGDCSADVPLDFGDVVEIPEADHVINERWPGLTTNQLFTLKKCLARHVQITVNGQMTDLTLAPQVKVIIPGSLEYMRYPHSMSEPGKSEPIVSVLNFEPFMLWPVLENSNLLLASSDLSRVHVKRSDPATGKNHAWTIDCSNPNSRPDFWLRNSDVIEVPEK